MNLPVIHNVGGNFDVAAGFTERGCKKADRNGFIVFK